MRPVPMRKDVMETFLEQDDQIAQIIYKTLYDHNPQMPSWYSCLYQAPETTAGYAARLIQQAANAIRARFDVNAKQI